MNTAPFTLGLIQMRCFTDAKQSLAHATEMLHAAAKQGVQVACLPELFLTEYFCQQTDYAVFDRAEPIPGPTSDALSRVAKDTGMVIVGSIFERRAAGVYHNTAVVFEKDGTLVDKYRKMHIPDDPLFHEKFYFTPGDLGFKAIPTSRGKLGTLVCWDQWYPEAARLTALKGADVLLYPTAIGWHPSEKKEWGDSQVEQWITIQRSHAIANRMFVGSVNRVGHEVTVGDGIEFFGNSFICDPYGRMLAHASSDKEEILIAEINPAMSENARRHWPHLRDRRIDAYAGITERWADE
jgi:N-carbamoylputrescine amidase